MTTNGKPILVIGGGIAGMTAAAEAAEVGYDVTLVEKEAYLGGRVVRAAKYFPKMCPPNCGFEINARRIRNNPRITVYTQATVEEIRGTVGKFRAAIRQKPRYVTGYHPIDDSLIEKMNGPQPRLGRAGVATGGDQFFVAKLIEIPRDRLAEETNLHVAPPSTHQVEKLQRGRPCARTLVDHVGPHPLLRQILNERTRIIGLHVDDVIGP